MGAATVALTGSPPSGSGGVQALSRSTCEAQRRYGTSWDVRIAFLKECTEEIRGVS